MTVGEKPTIEAFYDPSGNGGRGCWRTRLQQDHRLHDAGASEDGAVRALLMTLATFDLSGDRSDYDVVNPHPLSRP